MGASSITPHPFDWPDREHEVSADYGTSEHIEPGAVNKMISAKWTDSGERQRVSLSGAHVLSSRGGVLKMPIRLDSGQPGVND